jgi:hypothetical protein
LPLRTLDKESKFVAKTSDGGDRSREQRATPADMTLPANAQLRCNPADAGRTGPDAPHTQHTSATGRSASIISRTQWRLRSPTPRVDSDAATGAGGWGGANNTDNQTAHHPDIQTGKHMLRHVTFADAGGGPEGGAPRGRGGGADI